MKTDSTHAEPTEPGDSTSRMEAFSDGIFGVAITLLALEVGVEAYAGATNASLLMRLLALWPKYVAYLNSFATVLLMWLAHHQLFNMIRKATTRLILANGLLLLLIGLVPFPTKTVGQFIQSEAREVAVEFYTGYFLLVNAAFLLIWRLATANKRALLYPSVTDKRALSVTRSFQNGVVANLICFGLSFVSPWLGISANVLSWIYWAVAFRE